LKKNKVSIQKEIRNWFIVLSEFGYFVGLKKGGYPVWSNSYEDAKPLDNEAKFKTLQSMCYGQELILEYIK
jgi:hypothetical protein